MNWDGRLYSTAGSLEGGMVGVGGMAVGVGGSSVGVAAACGRVACVAIDGAELGVPVSVCDLGEQLCRSTRMTLRTVMNL